VSPVGHYGGHKPVATEPREDSDYEAAPELRAEDLDDFLHWAAGVPTGQVALIRNQIASATGDQALVDRLVSELWRLPVTDVGRHLLLLSTIGELRDERVAPELARFVWYDEDSLATRPDSDQPGCGFEAHPAELLQARAVEMLSYLASEAGDDETLRVAAEHPRPGVRAAAIDAHLFNHDDAAEEVDRLRSRVRAEEAMLVGRPRFTRDTDPREFERAVLDFYERYPAQRGAAEQPRPPHLRETN
jgi:hypothetical protein